MTTLGPATGGLRPASGGGARATGGHAAGQRAPQRRSAASTVPSRPSAPGLDRSRAEGTALDILGLRAGEVVRWRSPAGGRWLGGTVSRRERDGSIGVVDSRGAARSLPVERLWVGCRGPRGGPAWEPLTERATRSEQLCLLDAGTLDASGSDHRGAARR